MRELGKFFVFIACLIAISTVIYAKDDNQKNSNAQSRATQNIGAHIAINSVPENNANTNKRDTSLLANNLSNSSYVNNAQKKAAPEGTEESIAKATWWLVVATFALFGVTALLFVMNYLLVKDARATSATQAKDMKDSIDTAKRSANAMKEVADATKNNAELMQGIFHKQLRAYLVVDFGSAVYQDDNNYFEAIPVLNNVGFTPARKISYKIKADVLDFNPEEQDNIVFDDSSEMIVNDASLAPRQTFVIRGMVQERFNDKDAEDIMDGNNKRLCAWGKVTYEDIFGKEWETNFCFSYLFPKKVDGTRFVNVLYHRVHNDST